MQVDTCPHLESVALSPPSANRAVHREDCTICFDSIDDPAGLDVCLQCFNGGCAGELDHGRQHFEKRNHPLALNIRRTRKNVDKDEPKPKMTKLAIAAETEADRYDYHTTAKCHDCKCDLDKSHSRLAPVVDGIMKANTLARQQQIESWEDKDAELKPCKHTNELQQQPSRKIESGDLGHCSKCNLHENLWLCLECGNLGCGRAQYGGVGGNSHGLAHATESKHGVAVKLGSITPEGTADVYCYECDEERIFAKRDKNDPSDSRKELSEALANWGIMLAEQIKTEKSLAELQIDQNLSWDFSMTSEDGKELKPLSGEGLKGLKNLGNSCYLASIVQCLFDLPSFQARYKDLKAGDKAPKDPAQDLDTQLRKLGHGLLSGRYSNSMHQDGLAPSMLKHLIGKGHEEFSTMRQQDAIELLQHLLSKIAQSSHRAPLVDPTLTFRFLLEQRLQCMSCKKVRYMTTEEDSIFIDIPIKKLLSVEGEPQAYEPVTFKECLDRFTAETLLEYSCTACGAKGEANMSKRSLFKTFPSTLVVRAGRMTMENWVPRKVDVPVIVDDEPYTMDQYMSTGLQPGEELFPEEEAAPAETKPAESSGVPSFEPNEEALSQLMSMGFPRNRGEKALHATGNSSAEVAMEWLFGHMEDPDIDEPLVLEPAKSKKPGFEANKDAAEMLQAMGFPPNRCARALYATGNSDANAAMNWLMDHMEDPDIDEPLVFDAESDDDDESDMDAEPAEKPPAGTADLPANFQLQSIVCHKGTSIHTGHYVAFIRKQVDQTKRWVLFNDEKVVEGGDAEEMKKTAYVYFFNKL